ncbi:MAG: hypothetical protein ABFR05_09160 [Bacteroidota bacterium]
MNQLALLVVLFFTLHLSAQESKTFIQGRVFSDTIPVENIHIINKSTNKGTISNKNGDFKIFVSINDTITFSGVQFYKETIIISKQIIDAKFIRIFLIDKINELHEVNLSPYELTGNLITDSNKVKDSVSKVKSDALNFGEMDFSIASISVAKNLDEDRLPDPTDPNMQVGGDIVGLLSMVLKPVIKEASKIGKKKRVQKEEERKYQIQLKTAPQQIREDFGDDFFIETLGISVDQIEGFILHCVEKGINNLFLKNKKIEMIDVFLSESKKYKK